MIDIKNGDCLELNKKESRLIIERIQRQNR